MALIAIRSANHITRHGSTASRHEIVGGIGIVRSQAELGEVSGTVNPDPVRSGRIETRRRLRGIRVDVLAGADGLSRATRIRGCLCGCGDLIVAC